MPPGGATPPPQRVAAPEPPPDPETAARIRSSKLYAEGRFCDAMKELASYVHMERSRAMYDEAASLCR